MHSDDYYLDNTELVSPEPNTNCLEHFKGYGRYFTIVVLLILLAISLTVLSKWLLLARTQSIFEDSTGLPLVGEFAILEQSLVETGPFDTDGVRTMHLAVTQQVAKRWESIMPFHGQREWRKGPILGNYILQDSPVLPKDLSYDEEVVFSCVSDAIESKIIVLSPRSGNVWLQLAW